MGQRRLKLGDVLELTTPTGRAYLQYSYRDQRYGHLVRVLPGVFSDRPRAFADLARAKEQFSVFLHVPAALAGGLAEIVGNEPIPANAAGHPLMRAEGWLTPDRRGESWFLFDGQREWRVNRLSGAELDASPHDIWNTALLADRIASGWTPRSEAVELQGASVDRPSREGPTSSRAISETKAEGSAGTDNRHAVIVVVNLPRGERRVTDLISRLDARLAAAAGMLPDAEYDGHEIATSEARFYIYGPDASQLAAGIVGAVSGLPFAAGSHTVLRFGPPGAPQQSIALV